MNCGTESCPGSRVAAVLCGDETGAAYFKAIGSGWDADREMAPDDEDRASFADGENSIGDAACAVIEKKEEEAGDDGNVPPPSLSTFGHPLMFAGAKS
ncbi:hypothetical protein KPH14_000819 [Odynerus spinipes]|uniref:Uncharacterized protein n=1 Tax=Odynerus spinipes TaxID=1348599 RepID=A0AAD9VHY0_9HYME|nr:hypothetical protein KPH14_000819 [Odynerus spinipes]